jgi:nicotinamide-nucleotide amidase
MLLHQRILILAQSLGHNLLYRGWQLIAAESCSGGQLAAALTQCPGSSEWFSHSLVTYSNFAKMKYLKMAC